MGAITVKVELSIGKPGKEVFGAVLNPVPYFVKKASGPMKEGVEVVWEFEEFPQGFPIRVRKVAPNTVIQFEWPRGEGKELNSVEFTLKPFSESVTTVFIAESGWPDTEQGREASYRNCQGWMHMACSLKAYLEYGINLRTGSFVHVKFDSPRPTEAPPMRAGRKGALSRRGLPRGHGR
ncbi:MAG: SRPBCC domain-containing protein [Candidatus Omnitrophica bacterium]|nr:SRPBCC domain-containing protein [Candidatus Omnitrophota bacterium]